MTENNISTVLIGGWADIEDCVTGLKEAIIEKIGPVLYFRYSYAQKETQGKIFETMEVLAERFYEYLKDNELLIGKKQFNIIGYSQGGMIALYSMGLYPKICKRINRFVSIAAPHGGALVEQLRSIVSNSYYSIKSYLTSVKEKEEKNIFTDLADLAVNFLNSCEDQLEIFGLTDHESKFLNTIYPEAAFKVFDIIPKNKLLEIYSDKDNIVKPESCKRFEEFMEVYQVDYGNHQKIANFDQVIEKVIAFLI